MRHTQIKRRSRMVCILLAVCMLLTLLPGVASASPAPDTFVIYSGTVGDGGAPWRLYSDWTAVVDSGYVYVCHYSALSPWAPHQSNIQRIIFTGPIIAGPSLDGLFRDLMWLNSIEGLSYFDTSNVQSMRWMFSNAHSLTNLDISDFDTSNVTNMSWMFDRAARLTSLDLSGWDISNVWDMSGMFHRTRRLTSLNLSGWDTSNVWNMSDMFSDTHRLTSLDLSSFDTSNVRNMSGMFVLTGATSLDLSGFDTSNVTDMSWMFAHSCLTNLDISGFDTSNVTDMTWMFWRMESLRSLDLSSFDTSNVTNMFGMFGSATSLSELTLGEHFVFQPSWDPYPDLWMGDWETDLPRVPFMGKWQNVGAGTVDNPQGEFMFTSEELVKYYDGATMADTWVWQPGDGRYFTDVNSRNWFFGAVVFVYENGIMQGTSATTFAPNGTLSRAMAATILHRLAGEPAVTFAPIFSDVAAGRWYADAITWAYRNDIVQGIGGGRFAPNDPVTREQFAAMLHRYAVFADYDVTVPEHFSLERHPDYDQVSPWAATYMRWANHRWLISGTTAGLLNPRGTATRAECATILMRFMELAA